MESIRNGIVIRIPEGKHRDNSLSRIVCDQIKIYLSIGYKLFIVELSEKDIDLSTDVTEFEKERFFHYLDDLEIRIAFYIKSKNHVISTDADSKKKSKSEILKIGNFINEIDAGRFDIPLICHIGGANGNRRKSMMDFCKFFDTLPWRVQKQIAIINDEKPSLFSVKDLLSVTYIEKKHLY